MGLQELSHASGHVDRSSGDVAGTVTCQEGDEAGDLVRLAESAQRYLGGRKLSEEIFG